MSVGHLPVAGIRLPSAQDGTAESPPGTPYVLATVGSRQVALPLEALVEVAEIDEVTPLPQAPTWLKGLTNLRGSVVPVVGLESLLGWEAPTPGRLGLVLRDGRFRLAVLVNAVHAVRVLALPAANAAAGGQSPGAGIATHHMTVDDRDTWLVNVEDVLAQVRRGEQVGTGGR